MSQKQMMITGSEKNYSKRNYKRPRCRQLYLKLQNGTQFDRNIEEMVNKCTIYCQVLKNPDKIPIHPWEFLRKPW